MIKIKEHQKTIVILGPTASGKSDLAVSLAKKFNGEIISADSRQVYKGMDLGTGKIAKKEMHNIPHYLLDIASPKRQFSVERYQKMAKRVAGKILKKNKLPIVCGGTAFYIDTLINNQQFPNVKPNLKLRKELEKLPVSKLFEKLKEINPERAKNIDSKNPHRLIRAIEIGISYPTPLKRGTPSKEGEFLKIGIKKSPEELKKRIAKRLTTRLKKGMIEEVANLRKSGLSWKRLESFGLEYRFIAQFLQEKISQSEMEEKIKSGSWQYAKRQMTWWKRDKGIVWVESEKEARKLVRKFLN